MYHLTQTKIAFNNILLSMNFENVDDKKTNDKAYEIIFLKILFIFELNLYVNMQPNYFTLT